MTENDSKFVGINALELTDLLGDSCLPHDAAALLLIVRGEGADEVTVPAVAPSSGAGFSTLAVTIADCLIHGALTRSRIQAMCGHDDGI